MEDRPVVEGTGVAAAGVGLGVLLLPGGQPDEVVHGLRRVVGEQHDPDVALVGAQGRGVFEWGSVTAPSCQPGAVGPSVVDLGEEPVTARS